MTYLNDNPRLLNVAISMSWVLYITMREKTDDPDLHDLYYSLGFLFDCLSDDERKLLVDMCHGFCLSNWILYSVCSECSAAADRCTAVYHFTVRNLTDSVCSLCWCCDVVLLRRVLRQMSLGCATLADLGLRCFHSKLNTVRDVK